jgi:hypothetical protein
VKFILLVGLFSFFLISAIAQEPIYVGSDWWNWRCFKDTARYKGTIVGYYINKNTIVDTNNRVIGYLTEDLKNGIHTSEHVDSGTDKRSEIIAYWLIKREQAMHKHSSKRDRKKYEKMIRKTKKVAI